VKKAADPKPEPAQAAEPQPEPQVETEQAADGEGVIDPHSMFSPDAEEAEGATDSAADQAPAEGATDPSDEPPPGWAAYLGGLAGADSWAAIREALFTLNKTPGFADQTPEVANMAYRMAWRRVEQLREADPAFQVPEPSKAPDAFRLWVEAQTDVKLIEDTWFSFASSPAYSKLPQGGRDDLIRAKKARITTLREGDSQ
jgi:hypothetical protein